MKVKIKKALTLVKEAAPLVATLQAVVADKVDVDPKIKRVHDNCDEWLHAAHAKLTREGVA